MANRNRTAGNSYELYILNTFVKPLFPKAVTCRAESRNTDDLGVDLMFTGNLRIQCKLTLAVPMDAFNKLKENFKEYIPIICWGRTHKKASRFYKEDDYVIMKTSDFFKLINILKNKEDE